MRLLELFSGTQSVGDVAKTLGYECISVDICDYKGRFPPTHKVDILNFNYASVKIMHSIFSSRICKCRSPHSNNYTKKKNTF